MSNFPDNDGVPPLEDMSALLAEKKSRKNLCTSRQQQQQANKAKVRTSSELLNMPEIITPAAHVRTIQPQVHSQTKENDEHSGGTSSMFNGMAGGFFKKQKSSRKKNKNKKLKGVKYDVKFSPEHKHVLPEVQEKMDGTKNIPGGVPVPDSVTKELFKKASNDPKLMKRLQNPRFMNAMQEIGKDPKGALEKYKGDLQVQEFVRDFMKILGKQYSKLDGGAKVKADKELGRAELRRDTVGIQEPLKEVSSRRLNEELVDFNGRKVPKSNLNAWLSNDKIRNALYDPKTGQIIAEMKNDPSCKAKYRDDPRIKVLHEAGIIQ